MSGQGSFEPIPAGEVGPLIVEELVGIHDQLAELCRLLRIQVEGQLLASPFNAKQAGLLSDARADHASRRAKPSSSAAPAQTIDSLIAAIQAEGHVVSLDQHSSNGRWYAASGRADLRPDAEGSEYSTAMSDLNPITALQNRLAAVRKLHEAKTAELPARAAESHELEREHTASEESGLPADDGMPF